eukprot:TCALIF_05101-PA protein Name:"Similar to SMARCC2 SWI/SNF complex subunit SMARCC2 (Homo sapiens)" AED:0.04 eAED:0.04 QI:0/0.66/0.57/0.85/1/1/7/277/1078
MSHAIALGSGQARFLSTHHLAALKAARETPKSEGERKKQATPKSEVRTNTDRSAGTDCTWLLGFEGGLESHHGKPPPGFRIARSTLPDWLLGKMAMEPKKNGGPVQKFWDAPEVIKALESVKSWLSRNAKKHVASDPPTAKSLSQLISQMIQFQEDHLGKGAKSPPFTRLPIRLFLNFLPDGPLCHILAAMYKFKHEQAWRRFDLSSPSRKEANLQMCTKVEEALIEHEMHMLPKLFLRKELDKDDKDKVKEVAQRRGLTLTEDETEATHILYPAAEGDTEIYCRPVFKKGDKCMVHFYRMPESRDNYGTCYPPEEKEPMEFGEEPIREEQYHVSLEWLMEMEEYNEFMTEEDFEVDETGEPKLNELNLGYEEFSACEEKPLKKKGSSKRTRSPSPSPTPKSSRKGKNNSGGGRSTSKKPRTLADDDDDDDLTQDLDDPTPDQSITEIKITSGNAGKADMQTSRGGGSTYMDMDEKSQDSQRSMDREGRRNEEDKEENDDNVTEQTHHIIVPSYSAWFDYNGIHTVEKRALPEFFNGKNKSKTPEVFISYRNFMIDTYRLNPTEYLTSTACRRNLAGDVCAIMRVHAFLEQWGLINYQVDIDAKPTLMGPPPTSHFHLLADTPAGLQPVNPPKTAQPSAARTMIDLDGKRVDRSSGQGDESDDKKKPSDIAIGTEFGLKTDQYDKKNAALKQSTAAVASRDWTEQETLLLLEALEMYKDDWNKVCEHVGSRTQDECILHFLRLPIEDPYLEDPAHGGGALGPLAFQPIPFSQAGNPIMSTVAFLASVVDPRVASSSAKAAMEEFARIKDEVPSVIMDAHMKNVKEAVDDGSETPAQTGLEKSGIAGTAAEKEDTKDEEEKKEEEKKDGEKSTAEKSDKKEEPMEVDPSAARKKDESKADRENQEKTENEKAKGKKAEVPQDRLIKDGQLQSAAATALSAAAVKAKHLAAVEERKIKSLVALLVETQMKKLEIKLRHFEELETIMDREREALEYQRQQLIQERQQFHLEQLRAAEFRARSAAQQKLSQESATAGSSAAPSPLAAGAVPSTAGPPLGTAPAAPMASMAAPPPAPVPTGVK